MLSFMREQGASRASDNQPAGVESPAARAPNTDDGQEFLTVAANKSSLRQSTIFVVLLVAVGLASLGYMIRRNRPQAAIAQSSKDEQTRMAATISHLTGISSEMFTRMDQIVKKFYEFSNVFQVGVNELSKNPFEVETVAAAVKQEPQTVESQAPQPDDSVRLALARRQQMKAKGDSLKLLSIMRSGSESVCMINDELLRRGDSITGFMVVNIGSDSVLLAGSPDGKTDPTQDENRLMVELKLAQ
jgi:hypothetical protein